MSAFYDATALLAVALLAIVVAIFVFGASLLGRAMKEASVAEEEASRKRSEEHTKILENIEAELQEVKRSGDASKVKKRIQELEKKGEAARKERKRIQARPRLLSVWGSVAFPGGLFLLSLFLAIAAKIPAWWLSYLLWGLSLGFLGWGCYRIYRSLKIIESVAITGEEAYLKSTTEAVKVALEQHKESRRPQLVLGFSVKKPPFIVKAGSEATIEFGVSLAKGDVAEHAAVYFFAPAGFDFPQPQPKWHQTPGAAMLPNALTTKFEWQRIVHGIHEIQHITIKAPSQPGDYKLFYCLYCIGFEGQYEEIPVKIEGGPPT